MIADMIARWLLPAMKRATNVIREAEESKLVRARDDVFEGCDVARFSVITVDNGTIIRLDSWNAQKTFHTQPGPTRPNIFIVKGDETVQDAIVRMLAIHQLEKQ